MSEWGRVTYGDPCRECGFRWDITMEQAIATVTVTPPEMARMLSGTDGTQRHPDLAWPAVAYVCHVSDNLRIWAERLAALAAGAGRPVSRYDQDLVARARSYDEVALAGALWSLNRAVGDWTEAVGLADRAVVTLVHPERGAQSVLDVVRSNAHDAWHHCRDIARTVDGPVAPAQGAE